jgi:hypothetical protein
MSFNLKMAFLQFKNIENDVYSHENKFDLQILFSLTIFIHFHHLEISKFNSFK